MLEAHSEVEVEEQLRVKIGEAKNICPRNDNGLRDVYCTICFDKELICRTIVVEKTLNPRFGEEFQLEIPRRLRNLTFYVLDRKRKIEKDKVLGKLAIKRDKLKQFNGKEHWFTITPVDAVSEVEGKIFVELQLEQYSKLDAFSPPLLSVRIIECSDLAVVNGTCDPYMIINLYNGITR